MEDLTWSGRFIDRRHLTELDKPTWDSITTFVHSKLTDEVIENAVTHLPPEHFPLAQEEIVHKLKSRRNLLINASQEYYKLVNTVVDIYTSNKDDFVEMKRISNKFTEVTYYRRDKKTGNKRGNAVYHKIFDNELTKEFRIYLLDGDDKVLITGEVDESPLVRVIGGGGKDEVEDISKVSGYFLSITPIPDTENKTLVYDDGKKTQIKYGTGTEYNNQRIDEPKDDFERYEPQQRDRSHDWLIIPILSFNSDDGFVIGGGPSFTKYNFRAAPFEYWLKATAAYATRPGAYIAEFNSEFNSLIKGAQVKFDVLTTELQFTKYYGYGNETSYDSELETDEYYKMAQEYVNIKPGLKFNPWDNSSISIGASYNYSEVKLKNDTLLSKFPGKEYGLGKLSALGINTSVDIDYRDKPGNPQSGFYINLKGAYFPELLDLKKQFARAEFDVRGYFTINTFTDFTFAFRTGGGRVWGGEYPFFGAVFLGGEDNLRGYSRQRFSGDASVFGQAELRTFLSTIRILLPAKLGFHAFAESGRVFQDGGISKIWHPSYGGGLWLSYFDRDFNLTLTLANSTEKLAFYFTTNLMF